MTVAKRGDLVVVHTCRHSWESGRPLYEDRFTGGVVTNLYRDGRVKAYRAAGWNSLHLLELVTGLVRHWIVPATEVDVDAAIGVLAGHHYPSHSDQPMPFDSLEEIRAALRPHLRKAVPA